MRLLTFEHRGVRRVGVRSGQGVVDLNLVDAGIPPDMRGLLSGGDDVMCAARAALARGDGVIPASEIRVLAPITDPEKVVCIGLNYLDHAKECGMPIPEEPVVFSKYPTTIVGPGEEVVKPPETQKMDYEVEFVAVVGKGGRRIPESEALDHIAGYTVGNDVSARDYQLEKPQGQWMMGKTFDTFAPIGPEIVTSDEVGDPHNLDIRCTLNGETVQESSTNQLIFGVDKLVAYLSHVFTLTPGDLIFTGTPGGVGMGRSPQLWLKPGDRVACEVDGVGRLENPVAAG